MLKKLKEELVQLHLELPKNNLGAWTSGNVSAAAGKNVGGCDTILNTAPHMGHHTEADE
jgi:hypothetical protein